jgi:chorismate synthase
MFDGLENRLARALFGIPGIKGVEFGAGFAAAALRGSQHNDAYVFADGTVRTRTNRHGGILGGISTGMPIALRVAVKPTPSIAREQETVNLKTGEPAMLSIAGRMIPALCPARCLRGGGRGPGIGGSHGGPHKGVTEDGFEGNSGSNRYH